MSRLRKQAQTKKLYHTTGIEELEQITASGMIMPQEGDNGAGEGGGSKNDPTRFAGHTFFATTLQVAKSYLGNEYGDDVRCILELQIEEDALLPDDDDMPRAQTWQESASAIGQVKVNGAIPDTYIKLVHVYAYSLDSSKFTKIFSTPYPNWQAEYEKNLDKIKSKEGEPDDDDVALNKAIEMLGGSLDQYGITKNLPVLNVRNAVQTVYKKNGIDGAISVDGTLYIDCLSNGGSNYGFQDPRLYFELPVVGEDIRIANIQWETVGLDEFLEIYQTTPAVIQAITMYMMGLKMECKDDLQFPWFPCEGLEQRIREYADKQAEQEEKYATRLRKRRG